MESASSIRVVSPTGQTIPGVGKYRYIAMLAEGGMADVFLAVTQNTSFEKLVVIKQLRDSLAQDPSFVAMFMDEARLAARLNHPNVVQTLEVGTDAATGLHFIAMEFLEGIAHVRFARLKDRIPPPLSFHLRIIIDTLRGLHYAHDLREYDGRPLNVVHRDVSPQNVMLTFAGGVKVLDFGIAKAALAAEKRPEDFKGKLEYMAPEQAMMEDVDRRADIFSVGVMLYEALARRRLYRKGDDKLSVLIEARHPKLLDVAPSIPKRLVEICDKAMAHHRDDRYATADAMADDLEDWLTSTKQHVTARDVGGYVAEKFSSTREKISAAVEAQLALIRALPEAAPDTIPISHLPFPELVPTDLSEPPVGYTIPPGGMPAQVLSEVRALTGPPPPFVAQGALTGPPPPFVAPQPTPSGFAPVAPHPSTSSVWSRTESSMNAPPMPGPPQPPVAGGQNRGLLIAAIAIGAIMVLGGALAIFTNARTKRHASVAPVVSASPEPSSTTSAPTAEETIEFTIKAAPTEARIFLDGTELKSNPASGKRARDSKKHVLRIEAEGHDPREESITFDRSVLINIELRPLPAAFEVPSGAPSNTPPKRGGRFIPPRRHPSTATTKPLDSDNPYQ